MDFKRMITFGSAERDIGPEKFDKILKDGRERIEIPLRGLVPDWMQQVFIPVFGVDKMTGDVLMDDSVSDDQIELVRLESVEYRDARDADGGCPSVDAELEELKSFVMRVLEVVRGDGYRYVGSVVLSWLDDDHVECKVRCGKIQS